MAKDLTVLLSMVKDCVDGVPFSVRLTSTIVGSGFDRIMLFLDWEDSSLSIGLNREQTKFVLNLSQEYKEESSTVSLEFAKYEDTVSFIKLWMKGIACAAQVLAIE